MLRFPCPHIACGMDAKLTLRYDRDADVLHISMRSPYPEQESEELGEGVVVRINPTTGEVENLEILLFLVRLRRGDAFDLPVAAGLKLAAGR